MRPISEMLVKNRPDETGAVTGVRESQVITPTESRVSVSELELAYTNDSLIFNSINKIIQRMFSNGKFRIKAGSKEVKDFMSSFIKNIGNSGSMLTWEELLKQITFDACKFGRSFVELVYNKRKNRIVDFDTVNIKTIDYAKDSKGNIVLDKNGNPVGYVQKLPFNHPYDPGEQTVPEGVSLPVSKSIFIESHRIAMIPLYPIGDGFYPMGLIEPVYRDSLRKLNLKESAANSAYWLGQPIIHAKLGNQNHEPNAQQIKNMLSTLQKLDYKKQLATPYYYDISFIQGDTSTTESARRIIELFEEEQVAGLGIPMSVAKNTTDKSGTAVQRHLIMSFNMAVKDIANRIAQAVTKFMLRPLSELEGFKEYPVLVYEMEGTDELDAVARRLLRYIESGILKPDQKIGDLLLRLENLPED